METSGVYYEYGQSEATLLTLFAIAVVLVGLYKCFFRYRLRSKTLGYERFKSEQEALEAARRAYPQKINLSAWCCHETLRFVLCYLPVLFVSYLSYVTSTVIILLAYDTYLFALNYIFEFRTARRAANDNERYYIYRCFSNLQCLLLCPWVFVVGSSMLVWRTSKMAPAMRTEKPGPQPEQPQNEADTANDDDFAAKEGNDGSQRVDTEQDKSEPNGSDKHEKRHKKRRDYHRKSTDDDDDEAAPRRGTLSLPARIALYMAGLAMFGFIIIDLCSRMDNDQPDNSITSVIRDIDQRNQQQQPLPEEPQQTQPQTQQPTATERPEATTPSKKVDDFFEEQSRQHQVKSEAEKMAEKQKTIADIRKSNDWSMVKYLVLVAGIFVCGFSFFSTRKRYEQLYYYSLHGKFVICRLREEPGFQYVWTGALMSTLRFIVVYFPIAPVSVWCLEMESLAPFFFYYNYIFIVRLLRIWYVDKHWARNNIEYALLLKNRTDKVSKYMCPWFYGLFRLFASDKAKGLTLNCPVCNAPAKIVPDEEREQLLTQCRTTFNNPKNSFYKCGDEHILVVCKSDKPQSYVKYYNDYGDNKDTALHNIYRGMS